MDILQEQQKIIDNINIIYDEMIETLNRNKKGTLQGLLGQTIAENNMLPNEGDEIGQHVLDLHQSYNEAEHIERERNNNNTGGKKRRIKNKTHKKRKNKNKKSRRFMRNK